MRICVSSIMWQRGRFTYLLDLEREEGNPGPVRVGVIEGRETASVEMVERLGGSCTRDWFPARGYVLNACGVRATLSERGKLDSDPETESN